jgi:hypothetical protein
MNWWKTFKSVVDPLLDVGTGGAFTKAKTRAEERTKAQIDIDQANLDIANATKRADLEVQQRRVATSETQRNADIANQQRGIEAQNISEQSRAAAIQGFQAKSAGEANLGTSGLAAGSSPYAAMDAQMSEVDRKIKGWFSQADASMNINEVQAGGNMDIARFNERSSVLNEGIMRSNIKQGGKSVALAQSNLTKASEGEGWAIFSDVALGALQTGMGLYGLGSSIEGLKLLTGTESLWDLGGALSKMSGGDILKLGGAQKYAAATGNMGPLQSMFAEGGAFGPAKEFGGFTMPPSLALEGGMSPDPSFGAAPYSNPKSVNHSFGSSSWTTRFPVGKDKIKSPLSLFFGG